MCAVMLCYVMATAMAAVPARREETCLQFPWRLASSSGLLASARALPTLRSANSAGSVNSRTAGTVNTTKSKTQGKKKVGLFDPKKGSKNDMDMSKNTEATLKRMH